MPSDLAKLYPEGRTFYYEGDDPDKFITQMTAMGLDVSMTVHVPAAKLDAFYALELRVGT